MSERKSPRRRILCGCLICCAPLFGSCGYFFLGIGQPIQSWYAAGPIQVLGRPEEAWIFLEKEIVVEHPGWGEHRKLVRWCNQEVVIITPKGVKNRISVPESKEISFHRNIGHILRQADGFYLLRGASLGRYGSMFRWEGDHFELLPLESYEAFLKTHELEHRGVPDDPVVNLLTEQNGWKHLGSVVDWFIGDPFSFSWNGQTFLIRIEKGSPLTKVRLHSISRNAKWEATLLEFDPTPKTITRSELSKLPREEPGYRKPGF